VFLLGVNVFLSAILLTIPTFAADRIIVFLALLAFLSGFLVDEELIQIVVFGRVSGGREKGKVREREAMNMCRPATSMIQCCAIGLCTSHILNQH
jgi:hypothetical protein